MSSAVLYPTGYEADMMGAGYVREHTPRLPSGFPDAHPGELLIFPASDGIIY